MIAELAKNSKPFGLFLQKRLAFPRGMCYLKTKPYSIKGRYAMLHQITPIPKQLTVGRGRLTLATLGRPNFKITAKNVEGELAKNALAALTRGLSLAVGAPAEAADGEVTITLELSRRVPKAVTKNADQAYRIVADKSGIRLTGYGEAGVYYAVTTLLQALTTEENEVYIPTMRVLDYPDLRTRGHFIETRYGSNLMTLADWCAVVDDMVSMKHNQLTVSLYGCWCVQYDGIVSEYVYIPIPKYPLIKADVIKKYYSPKKGGWVNEVVPVPMASEDFFGKLVAYGKAHGVEVLPLWNSYGHNTLIPRMYPEVAPIVGGEPSKIGFCVSSDATYELLFHIYDHIIDNYLAPNGVRSFHVGLDEVREERGVDPDDPARMYSPWCECPACARLSNQEKMISHAVKLISYLKSRGMTSVYLYNDLLTRTFNDPTIFYQALKEADLLDVAVVDWWTYTDLEKLLLKANVVTTTFPELGIRSTVKPFNSYYHWNLARDVVDNVYLLTRIANRDKNTEGLMSYAAWDRICDINHVAMADYSWSFERVGSTDDFRALYAARKFPKQKALAKRAFMLYKELTTQAPDANPLPTPEMPYVANSVFMKQVLAYYPYCYYRYGRDYPQNFPGDAVAAVMRHREILEPKLHELSHLADAAYRAFCRLQGDMQGDFGLARRYAAEARNNREIVDDYIALLEIDGIVKSGAADAARRVERIAAARKASRLALIAEMEDFKEEYLHASHLRNQSIYMQVFADIEAYARRTPAEEFTLDVCDLRGIASGIMDVLR